MTEPAYEDLNARARIRDAAIRLFADRGLDGTTVRDIAAQAGVSPGLLRHHFGSKEALREACDAYVLERLVKIKEEVLYEDGIAKPTFLPSVHPMTLLYNRYVTRALLDGSATAAGMFDDIVVLTEQWLLKHAPHVTENHHEYAAVMVGMQSGLLAMHEHVSRALGADIFTTEGNLRLAAALIEFYVNSPLDDELVAKARQALGHLRAAGNPPPPDPRGQEGA